MEQKIQMPAYRASIFGEDMTQAMLKEERNKAIDEAMEESAKAICIGCGYLDGTKYTYTGCNCGVCKPMLETVMKALEQLKARYKM